jgi:DNA-binding response OmpR family regulator
MSTAVVEAIIDRTAPDVSRRRVLIVQNDRAARDQIAETLDAAGFDVATASDAFGARRRLQQGPVDVVLCAIDLPGLSGLHVCREIRRDPMTAGLPVIMMGEAGRPDAGSAVVRAGASGFMFGPLHVRSLLRQLRDVL